MPLQCWYTAAQNCLCNIWGCKHISTSTRVTILEKSEQTQSAPLKIIDISSKQPGFNRAI